MADGIDALFAALAGDTGGGGGLARSGRGVERSFAGIDAANTGLSPPEPGQALSAQLSAPAHHGGTHLPLARPAHAGRGRPAYMGRSATQSARGLVLALSRAEG